MTRGRTRLYLSLDKLERTSWSYTGHMLCASIVPLDALMVGKVRLVGDADARSMQCRHSHVVNKDVIDDISVGVKRHDT